MPDRKNSFSLAFTGMDRYFGFALYGLWTVCLIGWAAVSLISDDFIVEARIMLGSAPNSVPAERLPQAVVNRATLAQWAKRLEPSAGGLQLEQAQERLADRVSISAAPDGVVVLKMRDSDPDRAQHALSMLLGLLAEPKPGADTSPGLMVVAQPKVIEKPSLPSRAVLSSGVMVFALLAAFFFVVGSCLARPALRSSEDLAALTGLPVLGSVPVIWQSRSVLEESQRQRRRLIAGLAGLGAVFLSVIALEVYFGGVIQAIQP